MNILYLAHRIPYPPNKGDKIRSFRQLEHLAKRHRVWCACFVDTPDDAGHVETLREHCADVIAIRLKRFPAMWRGLFGLIRGATLTESFYRSREMTRALRRWTASTRFDAVVAFSSSMASFALEVPTRRRVLDCCDLDSRKWQDYAGSRRGLLQRLYYTEGVRLARREVQWLDSFDATIVITEHEAEPLLNATGSHRLHVVRNGVTLDRKTEDAAYRTITAPIVGFIGALDYRPNVDAVVWFVKHCWPGVRAAVPDAVFRIVGRSPVRGVRRLARVDGVSVVGEVPDVTSELEKFAVSVAPLRIARGLQNKVLEAMAAGKPVVLSSGAAEGIAARDRTHFFVSDRVERVVGDVVSLLGDPAERARLGHAARRFVESHHRWDEVLREFELVVTGVTAQAKACGSGSSQHLPPVRTADRQRATARE